MAIHPIIQNALDVGKVTGGFGATGSFMVKGQQLEEQGASTSGQISGGLKYGVKNGIIAGGVGVGVSGTAMALAKILKR